MFVVAVGGPPFLYGDNVQIMRGNINMNHTFVRVARLGILIVAAVLLRAGVALALRPMGMPINTTVVISKPAPGQIFGNQQVITMGVGGKEYRFILDDAYVDDRVFKWPDIWEQVNMSRPNFVMQGSGTQLIEHLEPGQQLTVKGMVSPLDRTFEIIFVQPGKGPFEPKREY
jgi:hypothetical protein